MITKKFLRRVVTERYVITKDYTYSTASAIDSDSKYCIKVYRSKKDRYVFSLIAVFHMDGRGWELYNN